MGFQEVVVKAAVELEVVVVDCREGPAPWMGVRRRDAKVKKKN